MEKWEEQIFWTALWLIAKLISIGCVIYFFMYFWVLINLDIPGSGFMQFLGWLGIIYGIVKIYRWFFGLTDETSQGTSNTPVKGTGAKTGARKSTKKATK